MKALVAQDITQLIGQTPMLKLPSLSSLSGCEIFVKNEALNPGGSIKDRPALRMVQDAVKNGELKEGMTIVEGTAGNTGIGLAIVAKAFGMRMLAVMPSGQAQEKERMIALYGADLKCVEPVPFTNDGHFYHTARRLAEEDPKNYWWANQFENLSNFYSHYDSTAPEIFDQLDGEIDYFVSAAGSGGTIAGISAFLKEKKPKTQVHLVDPEGSGLKNYVQTGKFETEEGSTFAEGIGITRLVENFKKAQVDEAFTLPDQDAVTIAHALRDRDGILVGSSAALNIAAAFRAALQSSPGKRIVTILCDLGERSASKLFNPEYLKDRGINPQAQSLEDLIDKYKSQKA
jgi:cysteine synthase A